MLNTSHWMILIEEWQNSGLSINNSVAIAMIKIDGSGEHFTRTVYLIKAYYNTQS